MKSPAGFLVIYLLSVSADSVTATVTDAVTATATGEDTISEVGTKKREPSEEKWQARMTQRATPTVGNYVAGGSGYGLAFDYTRADTIGLHWRNLPSVRHTVEYWYCNTDLHLDQQTVLSYSAYNVRGFQGAGGMPYEQANELLFMKTPQFLALWRGTGRVDLDRETNPRIVSQMWTPHWHHFAYVYDAERPFLKFYLDGDPLDFGTTQIGHDGWSYEKAPFSNDWDEAEHPDAGPYFGNVTAQVSIVANACDTVTSSLSPPLPVATDVGTKVVALILQEQVASSSCSLAEQAKKAEEAGAWAVVFGKNKNTTSSDASFFGDDGKEQHAFNKKLSVPVFAVDWAAASNMAATGRVELFRSRSPVLIDKAPFRLPIETVGVLAMGQEPDKPWGDFDPFQSANGVLDEFRVWDTVRTAAQIKEHYKRAIDVATNPDAEHLNIYWTFDSVVAQTAGESGIALTPDSSPTGQNPGLLGNLPTTANEMTYANGSPRRPPTVPLRLPTAACPLVGRNQEVVVPVAAGAATVLQLKSFDPDGDDLQTVLVTIPQQGSLHSMVDIAHQFPLAANDTVIDTNRTENKRVVYVAPINLSTEATFVYSVTDGVGAPVNGVVRLIPHVVENPANITTSVAEDTLTFFSLARPSQVTQHNMLVEITTLPKAGRLFQAQFEPDKDQTYTSLAVTVDQFGEMDRITAAGTILTNDRGIVMYLPDRDEASPAPDQVYASFRYRFLDPASGLYSQEATRSIVVSAVNDPPVSKAVNISVSGDGDDASVVLHLTSSDVDADAAESFAVRPFARITSFPKAGHLYQYSASSSSPSTAGSPAKDNRGALMDSSVTAVPQTFAWAATVKRFSSQFSQCGDRCFSWRNPTCPSNDVLSGGFPGGTCSATAWQASQILGPPDVYPQYSDAKKGWDLSEENAGHEFIELEFPFAVYINAFELYETYKPGSVWRVSTAPEYLDDPNEPCLRETCSQKTAWQTLWTKPQQSVTLGQERATIFAPPLCPSTFKSNLLRLDLDTLKAPGWNNFDAAKVTGSLAAPPGLVKDSSNRLMYAPLPGIHGTDRLAFASSDCLGEGEESLYNIRIEPPVLASDSSTPASAFFEGDIILALEPGQVQNNYALDLAPVLEKIQQLFLGSEQPNVTAKIASTTSLGSQAGEVFANLSLTNTRLTMDIGAEHRGAPFPFVELWLEHHSSGLTFRARYRTLLQIDCVNGVFDLDHGICVCSAGWVGEDCSVPNDGINWGLAIGLPMTLVFVVGVLTYLFYENKRKQNDSVWQVEEKEIKFPQPPVIVGRGTFGVVLLAEYRGTQVAVKRVIPPKSAQSSEEIEKSRFSELDKSSNHSSTSGVGMTSDTTVSLGIYNTMQKDGQEPGMLGLYNSSSPKDVKAPKLGKTSNHTGDTTNVGMKSGTFGTKSTAGMSSGYYSKSSSFWAFASFGMGRRHASTAANEVFSAQNDAARWRMMKKDFIEEMRYLSKLRHPCVTLVIGAVLGKDPMLVMEYMEHGSLYDLLHNETMAIEGELLLPILRDISQGVRFLHSSTPQVIHGDLKSHNILVDSKFRAKVADFGLSQKDILGGAGTPYWMAPELLRRESPNSAATDCYSFGIILYEVYSRRDPYEDYDPDEVLRLVADKSVRKRPPAPSNMPTKVKSLMADCLEDDPEMRPTFEELDTRVKRIDAEGANPCQQSSSKASSSISLFDIFPRHIAEALRDGRTVEAEHKECVTIFFSDIVGFTTISSELPPRKVADMLDRLYTKFDKLSETYDVFKVETIGDAYMAVANLVKDQGDDHAKRIAEFAIDAIDAANETCIDPEAPEKGCVNIRVGFHSGSVVADVVGTRNPRYCLFGDTVNTASRMESSSESNRIHCSRKASKILRNQCPCMPMKSRGTIAIKGKGSMSTFWVNEGEESKMKPHEIVRIGDRVNEDKGDASCLSPPPRQLEPSAAQNKMLEPLMEFSKEFITSEDEFPNGDRVPKDGDMESPKESSGAALEAACGTLGGAELNGDEMTKDQSKPPEAPDPILSALEEEELKERLAERLGYAQITSSNRDIETT